MIIKELREGLDRQPSFPVVLKVTKEVTTDATIIWGNDNRNQAMVHTLMTAIIEVGLDIIVSSEV